MFILTTTCFSIFRIKEYSEASARWIDPIFLFVCMTFIYKNGPRRPCSNRWSDQEHRDADDHLPPHEKKNDTVEEQIDMHERTKTMNRTTGLGIDTNDWKWAPPRRRTYNSDCNNQKNDRFRILASAWIANTIQGKVCRYSNPSCFLFTVDWQTFFCLSCSCIFLIFYHSICIYKLMINLFIIFPALMNAKNLSASPHAQRRNL